MKKILVAIIALCAGLTPLVALSQSPTDVINCNRNGVTTASAGSTEPLRGPYVPVADYAVELNTGLLVLKECVLRELATSYRKASLAAVDQQTLTRFNTGNGGGGFPSRELGREEVKIYYETVVRNLDNNNLAKFSDAIEGRVKNGIARGFYNVRDPRNAFSCEYADNGGNLNSVYGGIPTGNFWDGYDAVSEDPACSVFSATDLGYETIAQQGQYEVFKNRERLDWGQGVYDVAHYDQYGFRVTDTPGRFVSEVALTSVLSPYVQAQQADDIGEMINGLYLGVTNQVLTASNPGTSTGGSNNAGSAGGLAGLTQAISGAVSYMGQVVQQTGGSFTQSSGDAVIGVIERALTIERQYNKAVTDTAALFTATNAQLRSKETQCFNSIVEAVCQNGTVSSSTCTSVSGGSLTIARSTGFSQKVFDASIRPLTTVVVQSLNSSNGIVTALEALIAGLRINNSSVAQTAAMASLAAIRPHDAAARDGASQNLSVLSTQMATLVSNTSSGWEGSGAWCDVASDTTKANWSSCWGGNSTACPQP